MFLSDDKRGQMVEEMIDELDDWDLDTLLVWAKENMKERLENLDDDTLTASYQLIKPLQ